MGLQSATDSATFLLSASSILLSLRSIMFELEEDTLVITIGTTGAQMNLIPKGHFIQGGPTASDPQQISRYVELTRDFYMQDTPVTQEQYEKVMGTNPSNHKTGDTSNHPVENVSWYDAVKFCNKLSEMEGLEPYYKISDKNGETLVEIIDMGGKGYRLPTEAEWEYAAASWMYPEKRYGELDDIAWHAGNSGYTTQAVKQKLPNMFGMYDMIGNVWEWCFDWYAPYEPSLPEDEAEFRRAMGLDAAAPEKKKRGRPKKTAA
jgi:formylglycine-generating enzyme required for sulfatase activity